MLRAVELDRSASMAWFAMAGAYTDIEENANAIDASDQAVQLQPEPFDACHRRARAYFFAKDYEKSLAECERGIELVPDGFFPRTLRAEVLAATGDRIGALEDLAEAERMAPGEPTLRKLGNGWPWMHEAPPIVLAAFRRPYAGYPDTW